MASFVGQNNNNDIFIGTSGNDTFIGNRGNDQMTGNRGNDVFVFDRLYDRDSILDFGIGDKLDFSKFHISDFATLQKFMVQNGSAVMIETKLDGVIERLVLKNKTLASMSASDFIFDTSGTTVVSTGGTGVDHLFGARGADVLRGEGGDDRIYGGAGNDRIYGGDGNDVIEGGTGNDRIYTGAGNATVDAGTGTDLIAIEGRNANHNVFGGTGADTFRPASRGFGSLFIQDFEATDRIDLKNLGISSWSQLKSFLIQGADPSLSFVRLGFEGAAEQIMIKRQGAISLTESNFIFDQSTTARTIQSTSVMGQIDVLIGGLGNDVLSGGAGNDILSGGAGPDLMRGGNGNDTYYIDHGRDKALERVNEGYDTVKTRASFDGSANFVERIELLGSIDLDARGGEGENYIVGNSGDNILDGGTGADHMEGGAGNDTYYVDNAQDYVYEQRNPTNTGHDSVFTTVSYVINKFSGVEDVTLLGSKNIGAIGNSLENTLIGNDGGNLLRGGGHRDLLIGNGGADRFDFNLTSESSNRFYDRIKDLSNDDIIDLFTIDADNTVSGDQAFTIVDFFTGGGGELTLAYDSKTGFTTLLADVNGDLVPEMRIVMDGNHEDFMGFRF